MEHKLDIEEYASRLKTIDLIKNVGEITMSRLIKADDLTTEEISSITALFPPWEVGVEVSIGYLRQFNGQLYRCGQDHTTQADWTPDVTPALWVVKSAPGTIPAWVQPTGAQDAYNIGDQVTHDGKTWVSGIDANTTVPGENPAFDWWTEVI